MDSTLFHYALIPTSKVPGDIEWITDDESPNYQQIDSADLPENIINSVYALYQKSYLPYTEKGIPPLISNPYQLLKYNRWLLVYDDDDQGKNIVCFFLFKTTDYGLKSGLTGSNGNKPPNSLVQKFKIKSFNLKPVFGEISDRLETIIIKEVPVVEYKLAKEILNHFGKTDVKQTGKNHYTRRIGNLGVVKKIMVGIPMIKN